MANGPLYHEGPFCIGCPEVNNMKSNIKWILFCCIFSLAFLMVVQWGSGTVEVISQVRWLEPKHTIILDAGHGGEDGGTVSGTGRMESDYNLEITLRLRDVLNLLGFHTALIRDTDTAVYTKGETLSQKKVSDLKERVRMVNETENAILISIHQNHFSDKQYSGAQVFYPKTGDSSALAKQLQSAFVTSLNPGSRRQAKLSQGIYLMEHINCTGVLIECGFLSNTEEAHQLSLKSYQQKICSVIATELARYLSNT